MKKNKILLFLLLFLSQGNFSFCLSSKKAEKVITNPKRWDGFGSQFITIIVFAVYAELKGLKFIYTPFKEMEHNYDNDPDFLAKKEWLINFKDNFELNDGSIKQIIHHNYNEFFDAHLDKVANSHTLKKIKRIFRENKNIQNYFNNNHLNIVIHVRRPNPHDNRVFGTDTADDFYLKVINKLRVIYSAQNPLFHVHSQGERENFKKFNAPDIVLHLNNSVEDSFIAMVLADVLFISQSCLSYVAGFLSEGTVYHMPCPAPLPGWISTDELLR